MDAAIGALVSAKLQVRRVFRRWRAAARTRARTGGGSGATGGLLEGSPPLGGKPSVLRGEARLPARPPDVAPRFLPALLFLIAFCVRAWRVAEPPSVVFDELHFGKFVRAYWAGKYYFDIHPPLGKLNLYAVSRLVGNAAPSSNFTTIGDLYDVKHDPTFVAMRLSSAVFGAGVPPVTYLICRELGLGLQAALIPAVAQAFDSLVIVESRLILMDAQLAFFMASCLLCALRLWGARKGSQLRAFYLVLTALSGALALSIKWTSLATPALVAIVSLTGAIFPRQGALDIAEMAGAGSVAVCVYMFFFYIHFAMLPYSGDGDRFMTIEFQKTLIGNAAYSDAVPKPWFISSFMYLNARMLSASAGIKTRHRWESKWYQWIVSQRGVLYHLKHENGLSSKVYLVANIAVVYAVLISVLTFGLFCIRSLFRLRSRSGHGLRQRQTAYLERGVFLLAGYVCNLLPYILVSRCTFLYHYVPALFYGELLLANSVDVLPVRARNAVFVCLMSAIVVVFGFWAPWTYAIPLTSREHSLREVYGSSWE